MTRFIVYLLGLLASAGATYLAAAGLASYDPNTQMLDPHPVHLPTLVAGLVASLTTLWASITALWAWWTGKVGRTK